MNMFHNAKVVKLRGYHEKYLLAVDDQESVIQGDNVSTKNVEWTIESVAGSDSLIRLKSCYGKYLTASDEGFYRFSSPPNTARMSGLFHRVGASQRRE